MIPIKIHGTNVKLYMYNFFHLYRMRQKIEPKPENSAIPSKKLKLCNFFQKV